MLLLFILLIVNFVISGWDAYVAGRMWNDVSGFMKLVAWSALIMSVCGFLYVTFIIVAFTAVSMHWINIKAEHAMIALSYLMIIFPVLGSGLIITLYSWREAWKRRDMSSMTTAGWNTFAQGSNMYNAVSDVPSTWTVIADFFLSDEDEDGLITQIIVLILVLVAGVIAGGFSVLFFQMGRQAFLKEMQQSVYRRTN